MSDDGFCDQYEVCGCIHQSDCYKSGQAKEPLAGSPLESVVQGRPESPVPSNPAVQGTPPIEIIEAVLNRLYDDIAKTFNTGDVNEQTITIARALGVMESRDALRDVFRGDNTAPDTTSGIAGVP